MKRSKLTKILAFFFLLFVNDVYAQDPLQIFPNDSLEIFSTLNKADTKMDIRFGNRVNGLERCYRYFNDTWNLVLVTFYKDNEIVWSSKAIESENFDFSEDAYNPQKKFFQDTINIVIPKENGRIWLVYFSCNSVRKIYRYNTAGQINAILDLKGRNGRYTEFYPNGTIKLIREGDFGYSNQLKKGTEQYYNENGELTNYIDIDFYAEMMKKMNKGQ